MTDAAAAPVKDVKPEEEPSEEDSDVEEVKQEDLDAELMEAAKANDLELVVAALDKQANPQFKADGWSPLLWAACNGNEDMVRILIKRNAGEEYLKEPAQTTQNDDDHKNNNDEEEEKDPFYKELDARKHGKYSPLHWASYKGYFKVVWVLQKYGMNPLQQDMYGNTSVHQAAASGNIEVLKTFMAQGVYLKKGNSRKHTPLMLTTEPETKALIIRAGSVLICQNLGCPEKTKFDFQNLQYYCATSAGFYCKLCVTQDWVYEHKDSTEKERPVCRCNNVQKKIEETEEALEEAMEQNEYYCIDKALENCKSIDIDVKMRYSADVQHLKLQHELKISTFLKDHEAHDNYKDIRKDVQKINEMVEEALALSIELDASVTQSVNDFTSKIISERNLRKQRDLYLEDISNSNQEKVEKLQNLIEIANQNNVENSYVSVAEHLSNQMSGNIKARQTLDDLEAYPIRIYPEIEETDPKKKKKEEKKKKGRKKKEPAFATPEWALELDAVIQKVKNMEQLAADKQNLKLDDEFCARVKEQIQRFKKEIGFRKMLLENERLEAELKALKKAKGKKKK